MKPLSHSFVLHAKEALNADTVALVFQRPEGFGKTLPGQFLQLSAGQFLRRPYGIFWDDSRRGLLAIGVKVIGPGSRFLAALQPGEALEGLGPLGNGFLCLREQAPLIREQGLVIAVGGGSGIFPLFAALQHAKRLGARCMMVAGFRRPSEAFLQEAFQELCEDSLYCSDQGGLDLHGHAGQGLETLAQGLPADARPTLLACGPVPLMRACQAFAKAKGWPAFVSLEERMACGIGLCLGCAVDVEGPSGLERLRCCLEGPVFAAHTWKGAP